MTIRSATVYRILKDNGVPMWADEHWRPADTDVDVSCVDDNTFNDLVEGLINEISDELSPIALERVKSKLLVGYDTVELEIDDKTFNVIARAAHEQDITLNEHITNMLKDEIEAAENEQR